jgi:hypothetical protein
MLKKAMIVVAWTLLGTTIAVAIGYIPGALDLVDDYRWGRVIGLLFLPTLSALFVAGLLLANGKWRTALLITALVFAGYCALTTYTIVKSSA